MLSSILSTIKKNKKFQLKNGLIFNDFIYIEDVVSALSLLQEVKNKIINICNSNPISNLGFINMVKKLSRIDESLISVKNLDKKYLIGSNRKLKLFGWKPKYNLLSGIKKTIKLNNSGR